MKVSAYEWEDIGVENCQYFQGRGTADWDAVFIGIGMDIKEAISDALENAASSGWDTDTVKTPSIRKNIKVPTYANEDIYYHVALYLKV